MDAKHVVILGIWLIGCATVSFVASWIVLEYSRHRTLLGVEKTWFRCVSAAFYVGLAILFSSAVASLVQNIVKSVKGTP